MSENENREELRISKENSNDGFKYFTKYGDISQIDRYLCFSDISNTIDRYKLKYGEHSYYSNNTKIVGFAILAEEFYQYVKKKCIEFNNIHLNNKFNIQRIPEPRREVNNWSVSLLWKNEFIEISCEFDFRYKQFTTTCVCSPDIKIRCSGIVYRKEYGLDFKYPLCLDNNILHWLLVFSQMNVSVGMQLNDFSSPNELLRKRYTIYGEDSNLNVKTASDIKQFELLISYLAYVYIFILREELPFTFPVLTRDENGKPILICEAYSNYVNNNEQVLTYRLVISVSESNQIDISYRRRDIRNGCTLYSTFHRVLQDPDEIDDDLKKMYIDISFLEFVKNTRGSDELIDQYGTIITNFKEFRLYPEPIISELKYMDNKLSVEFDSEDEFNEFVEFLNLYHKSKEDKFNSLDIKPLKKLISKMYGQLSILQKLN